MNNHTAQLCPKCQGTGLMSRPPGIPADQRSWVSSTTGPYVCNLCKGAMVIAPEAVLRESTTTDQGRTWETSR